MTFRKPLLSRLQLIFLIFFFIFRISLYIGYSKNFYNRGLYQLSRPFSIQLWFAIFITILLSTVSFIIIGYTFSLNSTRTKSIHFNALNIFFRSIDIFMNQEGEESWTSFSANIVAMSTTIAAFFVVPAYTGAVSSSILIPNFKLPFKDLNGFVKDGSYLIGYTDSEIDLFEVGNYEILQKFWEILNHFPIFRVRKKKLFKLPTKNTG